MMRVQKGRITKARSPKPTRATGVGSGTGVADTIKAGLMLEGEAVQVSGKCRHDFPVMESAGALNQAVEVSGEVAAIQ